MWTALDVDGILVWSRIAEVIHAALRHGVGRLLASRSILVVPGMFETQALPGNSGIS